MSKVATKFSENLQQIFFCVGERICVKCQSEALRKTLNWRCQGHGVEGRTTRWSALSAPHCHGKWLRAQAKSDHNCIAKSCQGENAFIFV